jgi:AAA domain/RepB DNA-primase from phage plasmid
MSARLFCWGVRSCSGGDCGFESKIMIPQGEHIGNEPQAAAPITAPIDMAGERDLASVTNEEFLRHIYRGVNDGASGAICSIRGNLNEARGWPVQPASAVGKLPLDANNYFTVGSFTPSSSKPGEAPRLQRKEQYAAAVHVILIEDYGSEKAPRERFGDFEFSYVIETSQDNYQAGIVLREPTDDLARVRRIINALAGRGMTDKGAKDPATRLARLPNGVNSKLERLDENGQPFRVRAVKFDEDILYSLDELEERFDVPAAEDDRPLSERARATEPPPWKREKVAPAAAVAGNDVGPRERACARKALEDEAAKVASAPRGLRNDTLNIATFKVAKHAGAGRIDPDEIAQVMLAAAKANGSVAEDGLEQALETIESGLKGGMADPAKPLSDRDDGVGAACAAALAGGKSSDSAPPPPLGSRRTFASNRGERPPPHLWLTPDWVSGEGNVTALYGNGGVGKSQLAMRLQACTALGANFIGLKTKQIKSIGFYCEDSDTELWRRADRITRSIIAEIPDWPEEHVWSALENAAMYSREGMDNLLMTFPTRGGKPELTPFHKQVLEQLLDERASLLVIDNAMTTYAGDQNDQVQVNQFVKEALGGLGIAMRERTGLGSVLLCAHPSMSGMASGDGAGGSVAWNNAVRSRLYLYNPEVEGEGAIKAQDKERIELARRKSNYGSVHAKDLIRLKWTVDGEQVLDVPVGTPDGRPAINDVFLSILEKLATQGIYLSASASAPRSYAPKEIAKRKDDAAGYKPYELERAMRSLMDSGAIEFVTVRNMSRHAVGALLPTGKFMDIRVSDNPPTRKSSIDAEIEAELEDCCDEDEIDDEQDAA